MATKEGLTLLEKIANNGFPLPPTIRKFVPQTKHMKTEFKNILDIIGKLTDQDLFSEQELLPEEKAAIETWAGKSLNQIKEILSPAYLKPQLARDPFTTDQTEKPKVVFMPMAATEIPAVNYGIED